MEVTFFNVFITVLSLLILVIPGFLLRKFNIIGENSDKTLSSLILYGCQPMLMFMCFQKTKFDSSILKNMLIVGGLALLIHLLMILILSLAFRNKDKDKKINCLKFASIFGNCGYMGIPFIEGIFNGTAFEGEVLIYTSIVVAVFNLLNWSLGIFMISGDKKYMSFKKAFLNPTIITLIISIILFLTIKTPIKDLAIQDSNLDKFLEKMISSINFLSNVITPLSMIIIGIKLANMPFKEIFLNKYAYISSFNKLVLMSLITMLIVVFLPISDPIKYVLFFVLSMPSATNTVMFAVKFDGDGKQASSSVLLSTILSVLTVPLMYLLFNTLMSLI